MIGTTLSHFKITAKLGEGGMGEVYRAEDTKLGREVAIKVLPEAVASDPERLARFEREAKVLAALNHANIAAIYSLESAVAQLPATSPQLPAGREGEALKPYGPTALTPSPVAFLVMELAEGEDLKELIGRGPIPIDQALPIALQIADALETAHEKGIIHRDLKPANVKLTPDGQVKVLDFGLAKALDPQDLKTSRPQDLSVSPTLTAQMTGAGIILGTAAYMSPEQARGEEADRRSDIWSFGVLLTEMLTGGPVFDEPTVSDTLAAVLKSDPDLSRVPDALPPQLLRLIRRCLRKDPRERLRDIGDVALELREVAAGGEDAELQPAAAQTADSTTSSRWFAPLIGLAIGLVLAFAGMQLLDFGDEKERRDPRLLRFTIPAPEGTVLQRGLAISPDGSKIAFLARDTENRTMIWVRFVDSLVMEPVPGTEGAHFPFWSPDGKQIGFLAANELKIVDLIGTPPRTLAKVASAPDARGGSWGPDGTIIYTPGFSGGIQQIPATGGEPIPATELDPEGLIGTHRFPWFLPDGEHFVFYASTGTGTEPGEIHLGMLGITTTKRLTEASSAPVFAAPDQLIFTRGEVLVAQTFDLDQLELQGDPVPLGVDLPGGLAVSGSRSLSASATATLVFRADLASWSELFWVSRDGTELGMLGEENTWHYMPRISPDGKKVAVSRYSADTDGGDLWIYDRARGLGNPLVAGPGDEDIPAWSPDGQRLAFTRTQGAVVGLYTVELEIPGSERLLYEGEIPLFPDDWTKDGTSVLVERLAVEESYELLLLSADQPETPPKPFVTSANREWSGDISPDGRWVAFNSDATGRTEVYVRSFDGSEPPWQVSTDGGGEPCFSPDGTELYFVGSDGWIHAARVVPGDEFMTEDPTPLFDSRLDRTSFNRQFDVAPDGTFLLNRRGEDTGEPITVVMGLSKVLKP